MENTFRAADEWEHVQIEKAAKNIILEKAIIAAIFCIAIFSVFAIVGLPIIKMMLTAGTRALPTIAMLVLAVGFMGDTVLLAWLKYRTIQKKDYEVTEGVLVDKFNHASRHDFIKRRGTVRYQGGEMDVVISKSQSLMIRSGEPVFLIRMTINHFGTKGTFMICKKN